ncbi:MAG: 50S ribosomal protein L17 [Anaerolineae bacterium]
MGHATVGNKLGRKTGHRRAMFRNLMSDLFRHERIRTTSAKADAVRGEAERLITFARKGDLHARRMIMREIQDPAIVDKLIHVIGPDMSERHGGYTRIVNLGPRKGDAAPMVFLELVD